MERWMAKRTVTIIDTKVCSDEYGVSQVVTSGGSRHAHRRQPCAECPWRKDVPTGVFPAKAFETSAHTAYDGAMETFACHMSGAAKASVCAGFLLRHSENNIGIRLSLFKERIELDTIHDGGLPVYETYREMAVANGVPADDPILRQVRGNDDVWDHLERRWRARGEGDE
jgi:hypothetical protein